VGEGDPQGLARGLLALADRLEKTPGVALAEGRGL
jgi:hypothetical protein